MPKVSEICLSFASLIRSERSEIGYTNGKWIKAFREQRSQHRPSGTRCGYGTCCLS
jgi:hypothetical protein